MRRPFLLVILTIFIILASQTDTHARDVVVDVCDFASLQSAVAIANDGGGIITFDCTGTIVFTEQLVITDEVSIIADGAIIFDGGGATRFFKVNEDKSLTLDGLTIQNGAASYGGAIITEWKTTLIISNCTFLNNTTKGFDVYSNRIDGGAINNGLGSIIIRNSTFSNNSGGAIKNSGGVTINYSTFTDNPNGAIVNDIFGSSVTISDTIFTNNSAENGGAIQNGHITITNSTFTGNSATESGGAISTNKWVTISDSTFMNNTAKNGGAIASDSKLANGGSLTITNTTFRDNSASEIGGAIHHTGDEITLTGNTFSDNLATNQSAIFSDGLIISKDTRYENNTCGGYGVFADEGGNTSENALGCPPNVVPIGTTVTDCTNFTGIGTISQAVTTANVSSEPITFACSGTIVFTSSLFISGDVTIIGGGDIIFDGGGETGLFVVGYSPKEFPLPREVITPSSLLVDGVTLQNAGNGAIYNAYYGTLTVNNSTFSRNTDDAIDNSGNLTISNSTFTRNSGFNGIIDNGGTLIISNSIFSNNSTRSSNSGSAIMNRGQMTIQDTHFENNTCGGTGVLINNGGNTAENAYGCPDDIPSTTVVSDCDHFKGVGTLSEAVSVANVTGEPITFTCSGTIEFTQRLYISGTVTINGAGNIILYGGGVESFFFLNTDSSLILNDLTLQSGDAVRDYRAIIDINEGTVVINNSTISSHAMRGGYGVILNNGILNITNSTFFGNSSTIIFNYGRLSISNSTFLDNDGIAVYNAESGIATISNSTFSNNSGKGNGVIYNTGALTVTNSIFFDNSSTQGASAINNQRILVITDSNFTGNSALTINDQYPNYSGAIYNSVTLTITNSSFSENSADKCGAIYNYDTLTISNSTFTNNSATQTGGAVCNVDRLTITNSTFSNNSANQGGAIFNGQFRAIPEPRQIHMTITNSTLSDNVATEGGAIFNASDSTFLSQDTHYDNNDCAGSGIFTDNGGNTVNDADGCPNGS